jgi:hypothetical protein
MEALVIIGIIVLVIWIIIKANSSSDNKSTGTNSSKTIYEQKSDYQKELERKEQEQIRIREQERLKREREEQEKQKREREERQKREQEEKLRKEQIEIQQQLTQRQQNWKSNWQDYQKIIKEKNITVLYHFTDRANLQSIKKNGGLFSWFYCEQNGIEIPKAGGLGFGRDLDLKYGLENFVRLSFTKEHPMMYIAIKEGKINDPVILEINPEIIFWNGTKYSNMNATKTGHSQGENLENFLKIKFDIVKQRKHFDVAPELQKYYQAEIMVKKHIPLSFITNFNNFVIENNYNKNYNNSNDDLPF